MNQCFAHSSTATEGSGPRLDFMHIRTHMHTRTQSKSNQTERVNPSPLKLDQKRKSRKKTKSRCDAQRLRVTAGQAFRRGPHCPHQTGSPFMSVLERDTKEARMKTARVEREREWGGGGREREKERD